MDIKQTRTWVSSKWCVDTENETKFEPYHLVKYMIYDKNEDRWNMQKLSVKIKLMSFKW